MNSQLYQYSQSIPVNSSPKINKQSSPKSYNEFRENTYNRQKNLNQEIKIDVPELVDRETTNSVEQGWEEETNSNHVDMKLFDNKIF